jgi:hypothetical protein
MADEITDILITAWRRVRETLRHKPKQVCRRLQRGRAAWRKRPPRARSVPIRAADTRITPMTARCVPEHAAYPREAMAPELRTAYERHRVTLDVELLRELCAAVRIHEWGEPQAEVARRLGRHEVTGLRVPRSKGKLRTRFYPPTGGRGRQHVAVLAQTWLDPCAHLCQPADRVWGWTGKIAYWRVPDDLPPQEIERVPFYQDRTRAFADKSGLHPEHPLVDPVRPPKQPKYKLAPPPPDHVQYKWKGDQFIGYDWRAAEKNPLIREGYERHQRRLARTRAAYKARKARGEVKPRPGADGGGSLMFRGWMWICPICGKQKKVLYYPLPPINVIRGYGTFAQDDVIDAALAADPSLAEPQRASGLACMQCHNVSGTGRVRKSVWHQVVVYLSGGLLRGRDVPRPEWFTPDRKRPYRPMLMARTSKRPQALEMLERGVAIDQIARELQLCEATVTIYAQKLFPKYGVRTLAELKRKLGVGDGGCGDAVRPAGHPARSLPPPREWAGYG